jgi:arylsulfatase A
MRRLGVPAGIVAGLVEATASHAHASPVASFPPRPNIILVVADDLGYGELGCYGQTKVATPNIDRLAAEGVRATQFYSAAPVCAPSRSALLTGLHTGHTPIRDNRENAGEGQAPLPLAATTIADDLRAAGYVTACVGKWGLGFVGTSGDPNANGFDLFVGYNCQRQAHNFYPTHLWRNADRVPLAGNDPKSRAEAIYAPHLMLDEATRFIDRCASREERTPFFLFYATTLPHLALQPWPADLAEYGGDFDETPYRGGKGYLPHATPRAAYAAMISRLDRDVAGLREALERNGLERDTLLIVTSDNGATHDVGGVDTAFFRSTGDLRGRKGSLWEGGVRVPFVAWWPGVLPAGATLDEPMWTVDLRTTLASLADATPSGASDGMDLAPVLRDGASLTPRCFYWETAGYGGQQAVRDGRWKAIRVGLANGCSAWALFDLASDPREERDVSSLYRDLVERLAALAALEHVADSAFPLPSVD